MARPPPPAPARRVSGTPRLRHAGPWAPKAESAPQARGPSRASRGAAASDPLSHQATQALIRRTLCPQQSRDKARHLQPPIHELLPPLTSQNDVDLELYALLAIILRQFIQSWYATMTADEAFVAEILHLVAHCSRALEQRLRNLDLESLLLDELPAVLDQHIRAYRAAHGSVPQSPLVVDAHQAYHALWPLPFLSPVPGPDDLATAAEQQENESAHRQLLVQAVLAVLLPTEDLENPCLTALVSQILSELVIGDIVIQKVAQPWLLFEGIYLLSRALEGEARASAPEARPPHESAGWRRPWSVPVWLTALIQLIIKALSSIWLPIETLLASSSLPSRCGPDTEFETTAAHEAKPSSPRTGRQAKVPVMDYAVWRCAGSLLELPARMPWLSGFLALLHLGAVHGPGRVAGLNGLLDRVLSHCIQAALSPSCLSGALRTLRGAVFPNNAPGASTLRAPCSDSELRALRARAAKALWHLLPKAIGRMYFGGSGRGAWCRRDHDEKAGAAADEQRMVDEVEQLLMVLDDEYCNKHLVYSMLELLIVRLIPELVDKGVAELWEERLG